jgi:stage II sporulation protein R
LKTEKRSFITFRMLDIVLLLLVTAFLVSGVLAHKTQDELSDKVVRLHVVANSDSEEDQALKLRVRDRILERTTVLLEQSSDRREAEGYLRGELLELERIAAEEVAAAGYRYPVTAELRNASFPTREYDGFTLPAGDYLALRVVIGDGSGQNWWCVVFPPLCTTAAADVPVTAMAAGFSGEEVKLITEQDGYVLKLKTVEFWEELKQHWT